MLNEMTINAEQVRTLRDSRGWSQEHLAEVSGLSLRTIQRVESEGRASRETRLSLAAAFDVPLGRLAAIGAEGAAAAGRGESVWLSLIAVGMLIMLIGLATGLNQALLVAGAAIQVGGLFIYALDYINIMRRAAGMPPMLSNSNAVSGMSLLIIGCVILLLGYLVTGVVWWVPGLALAGFGAIGLLWPALRNMIAGPAEDRQPPDAGQG